MKDERMTAFEIRRSYAEAKNPKEQIKILAQLNLCTVADIKAIIEHKTDELPPPGHKPKKPSKRKPRISPEVWQEIKKKYESGEYTQKQLAKMYGISQATICKNMSKAWERAASHDKNEQPATEPREASVQNERTEDGDRVQSIYENAADRLQSVYELAAEIVEYIGQKYREVDRISVTKDANEIYVLVGHKNASVEITQKKGEPEDEQPYYKRSDRHGRRGL